MSKRTTHHVAPLLLVIAADDAHATQELQRLGRENKEVIKEKGICVELGVSRRESQTQHLVSLQAEVVRKRNSRKEQRWFSSISPNLLWRDLDPDGDQRHHAETRKRKQPFLPSVTRKFKFGSDNVQGRDVKEGTGTDGIEDCPEKVTGIGRD